MTWLAELQFWDSNNGIIHSPIPLIVKGCSDGTPISFGSYIRKRMANE